jgi:hypothetical protein
MSDTAPAGACRGRADDPYHRAQGRQRAALGVATHMKADRIPAFDAAARRLCAPDAKARYQGVTTRLKSVGYQGVPCWFFAVVSEGEYGGLPRWDRQLEQGDPLFRAGFFI